MGKFAGDGGEDNRVDDAGELMWVKKGFGVEREERCSKSADDVSGVVGGGGVECEFSAEVGDGSGGWECADGGAGGVWGVGGRKSGGGVVVEVSPCAVKVEWRGSVSEEVVGVDGFGADSHVVVACVLGGASEEELSAGVGTGKEGQIIAVRSVSKSCDKLILIVTLSREWMWSVSVCVWAGRVGEGG